jgi:hypothetical protein
MHILRSIVVVAIAYLQCGCRPQPGSMATRSLPVSYSAPSRASLDRLFIRRLTIDDSAAARIATFSKTNSPWGSRSVLCEPADARHRGPWTTRLYIFTGADTHQCIQVEARDHANGGVDYKWLNDRALFIRCWWGRIVSTDLVLDTETARFVYIQDCNYLRLILAPE